MYSFVVSECWIFTLYCFQFVIIRDDSTRPPRLYLICILELLLLSNMVISVAKAKDLCHN